MALGCPEWNLDTICKKGREYGFDGVDFRGYLGEIDITRLPEPEEIFTEFVRWIKPLLSG